MEIRSEVYLKRMYVDYLCNLINQSKYHKIRVFTSLNRAEVTYYSRKWYKRNETQEFKFSDLDKMMLFIYKVSILIWEYSMLFPTSWVESHVLSYDKWIEDNFTNEIRMY